MYVKRKNIISFLTLSMILIMIFSINYTENINMIIAYTTLILSVIWMGKCFNNIFLLVMSTFIAYSNYSIIVGIYIDKRLRPKYLYPQITDVKIYGTGIAMIFVFMLFLVLFTPKFNKNNINIAENFVRKENYNIILFIITACLFLIIIIVGYSGGNNDRGSSSALYEYGIILMILLFYFSGRRKVNLYISGCLCLIYVLNSLINGTRIEALMCIIVFVLCFFKDGIRPLYLFIGMIIGLIAFSVVGTIRGNWMLMLNNHGDIFKTLFENKLVFDTCTHAYFPMLCMIEEFYDFSLSNSLHYLTRFIFSIIMGQSRVYDGDLIVVVGRSYYHNNGGVTLGFFYVWFSYFGSFIFGMLVLFFTKFISKITDNISECKCCALLYIVASVPRWYLYGPWSITRGISICMIVFWSVRKMNNVIKRRRN